VSFFDDPLVLYAETVYRWGMSDHFAVTVSCQAVRTGSGCPIAPKDTRSCPFYLPITVNFLPTHLTRPWSLSPLPHEYIDLGQV